jgi:hypothetical protein
MMLRLSRYRYRMRHAVAPVRILAGAVLALVVGVLPATAGVPITSGHAGHWFVPERSGEGWVLEMRSADSAWLYWFTYDENGGQRWMTATGQVVNEGEGRQRIDFPQLVVTRGARFGADFDPADVVREVAGSARLDFSSCDEGRFSYEAFGQAQTLQVRRLARVMGSRCETPHGVTGREVADYAGQSGSWYDPTHEGEGFAVHWATPTQAIVTWYSYDTDGRQYWMLGTGGLDADGRLKIDDLHATRGARFGSAFDPADVESFPWGTLEFGLECGAGDARYDSLIPAFDAGRFQLQRLTSMHEVACPWRRPTLEDLYDLEYFESPHLEDPDTEAVVMDILVDGGRLLGLHMTERRVYSWQPGDMSLTRLANESPAARFDSMGRFLASDDAALLVINAYDEEKELTPWLSAGEGAWTRMPDVPPELSGLMAVNVSASGGWITGTRTGLIGTPSWLWNAAEGFTLAPYLQEANPPPELGQTWGSRYVSNDGQVVVGHGHVPGDFMSSRAAGYAVRWRRSGAPVLLRDGEGFLLEFPTAASDDGRVVFGSGRGRRDTSAVDRGNPWYWTEGGHQAWLGRELDGTVTGRWRRCFPQDASADGSLMVGYCMHDELSFRRRPFVWSAHTGMLSLPLVGDADGLMVDPNARVSADGRYILVADAISPSRDRLRSRLIRLQPRGFNGTP